MCTAIRKGFAVGRIDVTTNNGETFSQRFRRPCRRKGFAGTRVAQSPPGTSKPFRKTPLRNLTDGETFLERFRRRANRLTAKPFGPPGTAKPFPGYPEKVSPSYHSLKGNPKGFDVYGSGEERRGSFRDQYSTSQPRRNLSKVSTCLGSSNCR